MQHRLLILGLMIAALGAPSFGQSMALAPTIAFSVHDEPRDGLGDSFNNFTGLLREQSSREDRAMQEFDLTSILGLSVAYAEISGSVNVNNAFNNGLRTFEFSIYSGNGIADLTDFEIGAMPVGTGAYDPPNTSSFTYSLDVTDELLAVLIGGSTWLGFKCDPTSNPNFPNILNGGSTLTIVQGIPGSSVAVGTGCGVGTPTLTSNRPRIGTTLAFSFAGIQPTTGGTLYFSPGAPVPITFGSCTSALDLLTFAPLLPVTTDGTGGASLALNIPNNAGIVGFRFTLQALFTPTAASQGFDLTNGLDMLIGE